jgi:ABC-type glycerol-3-phosphate transport system substrate-binding protein
MKKNIIGLVSLLGVSLLASCGSTSSVPSDAQGKTILSVATYDGGVGKTWLENAKKRFEEKYKDTSFESGKTGVYVQIYGSKAYNGTSLLNKDLDRDVYYTEDVTYFDHVAKKQFLDLTDLVNAPLSDYSETKSIADKLDSQYKAFLTSGDGKYYAIPFYDGFYGFVYDVDLFDTNNWYFDDAGELYASEANKSKGPDNVKGTSDDGLPSTYAEFGKLFEAIRATGDVPFSYSGANKVYLDRALMNYWADYEGRDQMLLNYTFNGKANDLVSSFNGTTPVTGSEDVTFKNGYELQNRRANIMPCPS